MKTKCANCLREFEKASDVWACIACVSNVCSACYVQHTADKHSGLNVVIDKK